jgi:hypothetical protein
MAMAPRQGLGTVRVQLESKTVRCFLVDRMSRNLWRKSSRIKGSRLLYTQRQMGSRDFRRSDRVSWASGDLFVRGRLLEFSLVRSIGFDDAHYSDQSYRHTLME